MASRLSTFILASPSLTAKSFTASSNLVTPLMTLSKLASISIPVHLAKLSSMAAPVKISIASARAFIPVRIDASIPVKAFRPGAKFVKKFDICVPIVGKAAIVRAANTAITAINTANTTIPTNAAAPMFPTAASIRQLAERASSIVDMTFTTPIAFSASVFSDSR